MMAMVYVKLHKKNVPEIRQMSKSSAGVGRIIDHTTAPHFWMALSLGLRYDDGEDTLHCKKQEKTRCRDGNIF
ncbi:MAG: hypothetical protein ACP5EP_08115 [Acidobacteriaceae bacterium]